MKDPIVLHWKDILQSAEVLYWKDLLDRVVKIGTELEVAPPKGSDRPSFEEAFDKHCSHPSAWSCWAPTGFWT